MSLTFYHRYLKQLKDEKIYGEEGIKWLYGPSGQVFWPFIASSWASSLYGKYQSHPISKRKIRNFIQDYEIDLEEYMSGSLPISKGQTQAESYANFNEFFIRKFKENKRSFPTSPTLLGAFAEGRYSGFSSHQFNQTSLPVKNAGISAKELLGPSSFWPDFTLVRDFFKKLENGPVLIARLCPVDYHRFHFPDEGVVLCEYSLEGGYHSVNPIALAKLPQIFCTNKRTVTLLESDHFGPLAIIEVGATFVGTIEQTYAPEKLRKKTRVSRGQEKGMFLFGGSTVVLIGAPNIWTPSEDILFHTQEGREVFIHLGDEIGKKIT